MDPVIFIFFLPLFFIPFWFFLVPPAVVVVVCVLVWKRQALRNTVMVMSLILFLLIEVPLLGLHMYFFSFAGDGGTRLNTHFGGAVSPDKVVRHRFKIAGLGDTNDFWKLKDIDANDCQQIVRTFSLTTLQDNPPSSLMDRPWWWPKSAEPYVVYQGDDEYGGSIELWIPKKGSDVYLFKFNE